jgi:outer membrane lipoprotein-sorting protein
MSVLAVGQNSNEAKALLDKTYNQYVGSKGIRLNFSATYIDANGKEQGSQEGTAYVRGNKFRLEMESMNVWFDGKTQWVLMKDINEVNISNPSNEELASISPTALLGMYKQGFILDEPINKTINGKNASVIDMKPIKENGEINSIAVAIDKTSQELLQVTITMSNNTKNRLDISNYNSNYKFDDNEFVFDKSKHSGVEIVDLR